MSDQIYTCNNETVIGIRNKVIGNGNIIIGKFCTGSGDQLVIRGNDHSFTCNDSIIIGNGNKITGNGNKGFGNNQFTGTGNKNSNGVWPIEYDYLTPIYNQLIVKPVPTPKKRKREEDLTNIRELQCIVCWENSRSCVLLPCAHLITCMQCMEEYKIKQCSICKKDIDNVLQIYLS